MINVDAFADKTFMLWLLWTGRAAFISLCIGAIISTISKIIGVVGHKSERFDNIAIASWTPFAVSVMMMLGGTAALMIVVTFLVFVNLLFL